MDSVAGVAFSPSWESMSATSAALTLPLLSLSSTLKDSRILCRSGGGILERVSLDPVLGAGAARGARGVLEVVPSNLAAIEAVFDGRTVCCVDEDTFLVGDPIFLVGELGGSATVVVPRVFSHAGGLLDALLVVDCRRGVCDRVPLPEGFRGELVGVEGRRVEGECASGELGRRNGEVRELLKDSGEGLYGVGVVDCSIVSFLLS